VRRDSFNAEDVDRIIGSMSDAEKTLADYMFESLNNPDGARGRLSRTSTRLLGRDITVDNYWRRWKTNTYADYLERGGKPGELGEHVVQSLEGSGSLKKRVEGARGTVVIEDAFTAYYESLALGAKYESYAEALRQSKQLMHEIKDVARAKGLVPEYRAIMDWLKDVEGGIANPRLAQAEQNVRGLIGRLTSGALGWNPFVPMKQLASYPFAIADLEAKYLLEGLKMLPASKETKRIRGLIAEYSPQTEVRIQRHAVNTEMADYASRHEVENFFGAKKQTLADLGGKGIGKFDELAILRIYKAAEAKIKATTDLTGVEFNEATARLAEQAIRHTQPMSSTLERNAVQRAAQKSTWLKLGTMFTTPTNQIQNIWKREWMRFDRSDKTPEDYQHMISVIGTVWLANAGLIATIDSARDKAFGKEVTPYTVFTKMAKNTIAPYYFMQPVAAAIQDLGEYTVGGKRGQAYEFASSNLVDGVMSQAIAGAFKTWDGIAKDKAFETGDFDNLLKGTTELIDFAAKVSLGVSPRSAYRYLYEMPVSIADQILTPENEKRTAKLAASVGYRPRPLSKSLTIDKKEYILRRRDWEELDKKVRALVALRTADIDDDLWAAGDKKERRAYIQGVHNEVRRGVMEANKHRLHKEGKLVAKNREAL
jgi:hypothetical protein